MALDITVNVNYVPPSGDWIEDSAILAQRDAMVAAHQIGIDPILGFTGFTDLTGFTAYTATNADELRTHMLNASSNPTTKKVITCNWNGVSSLTSTYNVGGPTTGDLTAYVNAGADIGYDTPPHYTKIVAGEGYAPDLGPAGGYPSISLEVLGFGYIEWDGIGFTKSIELSRDSTYVLPPIVAMRNCRILNTNVLLTSARVIHMENCTFDGATSGVSVGTQIARIWNNECKNKTVTGDGMIAAAYYHAWKASWEPQIWVAGNITHSMDEVYTDASHFDWLQYAYDTNTPSQLNFLIEFNIANLAAPDTQGFFADGTGGTHEINILAHNNIITTSAYWNLTGKDPAGTGTINFYRNHSLRAALDLGAIGSTAAIIAMIDATGQAARTTGAYQVKECYYNTLTIETGMATNTTLTNNRQITNVAGANYVADVFTGNGSWGPNGSGHLTYDDPGKGLSRAAAFTAIRDFWEPISGYRFEGIGCTDPDTWPAPGAAWS